VSPRGHGTDDLVLLVANTQVEDADLWRFVQDSTDEIGVAPTIVADGRTPFEVFRDVRFLGNSRLAPCSIHLKIRPCRAWLAQHTDPADTTVYIGLDATEPHRAPAITHGWAPWTVQYPLWDPPILSKQDMLDWCAGIGIRPPRLYQMAFPHNNCGGVCVRGGQKHWLHLLEVYAHRYLEAEAQEEQLRAELGNVAILRERRGGVSYPLTLAELRRRHEGKTRIHYGA
jgi:hypothetical protein